MIRRRWLALGGMVVLVFVLVVLRGNTTANSSPTHLSTSDAADGTSALRAYADALGHASGTIEGTYSLPSSPGLLFTFTPGAFSPDEVLQLDSWLRAGGVVVYAAEDSDLLIDQQLGLKWSADAASSGTIHPGAPIQGGVAALASGDQARTLTTSAAQVPLLRNASGAAVALQQTVGQGQLVVLTDPLILCNGYLERADNGRFAADLIAMTPAGGRVWFDEFHHGAAATQSPLTAWMTTPWGLALLAAVLILFIGLAFRGRAFGPRIPLVARSDRSSAEYATAVGSLLHRTGARRLTLETLLTAARRAVAEQVGLGSDIPGDQLSAAIAQRAPAAAAELARAERELEQATLSEADLLALARRLHDLAYPLSSPASMKESA
jgi:hypothetical protein